MSERSTPPVLRVDNLKVHFLGREGTVRAVDGLSFDLYPNEVLGIVGESGCGKSVTARAILNILTKNARIPEGSVVFRRGEHYINMTKENPESRLLLSIRGKEISMIFQEPMISFSPLHTIGNQIGEAIRLHSFDDSRSLGQQLDVAVEHTLGREKGSNGKRIGLREKRRLVHERTLNILRRVGMPNPEEVLFSYPHNLSGGLRQRAMIAMALSCNPTVLIADEPTTALDVTLQAQVLALMREMKEKSQMSIIFITHDLGVIAEMTERVIVMYLGKAVESGTVDEIFYESLHPYTKALIASVPKVTGAIEELNPISGTVPSPSEIPSGCRFRTRCRASMPSVCDAAEPQSLEWKPGHHVACFLYDGPGSPPTQRERGGT